MSSTPSRKRIVSFASSQPRIVALDSAADFLASPPQRKASGGDVVRAYVGQRCGCCSSPCPAKTLELLEECADCAREVAGYDEAEEYDWGPKCWFSSGEEQARECKTYYDGFVRELGGNTQRLHVVIESPTSGLLSTGDRQRERCQIMKVGTKILFTEGAIDLEGTILLSGEIRGVMSRIGQRVGVFDLAPRKVQEPLPALTAEPDLACVSLVAGSLDGETPLAARTGMPVLSLSRPDAPAWDPLKEEHAPPLARSVSLPEGGLADLMKATRCPESRPSREEVRFSRSDGEPEADLPEVHVCLMPDPDDTNGSDARSQVLLGREQASCDEKDKIIANSVHTVSPVSRKQEDEITDDQAVKSDRMVKEKTTVREAVGSTATMGSTAATMGSAETGDNKEVLHVRLPRDAAFQVPYKDKMSGFLVKRYLQERTGQAPGLQVLMLSGVPLQDDAEVPAGSVLHLELKSVSPTG